MKRFFLSVLFTLFTLTLFAVAVEGRGGVTLTDSDTLKRPVILFDELGRSENVVAVDMRGNRLSGIMIVKKTEKGYLGTLINEFGIKAFDFEVIAGIRGRLGSKKRVKLIDVVGFMDRWYIRRVLRRDIDFMLRFPNVPTDCLMEVVLEGGNIVVKDLRYRISYTFLMK